MSWESESEFPDVFCTLFIARLSVAQPIFELSRKMRQQLEHAPFVPDVRRSLFQIAQHLVAPIRSHLCS